MSEWIKASERLPEENGMYLTIAYTKELVTNGDEGWFEYGTYPEYVDDLWESHKNIYKQMKDGKWVEMKWKRFVNGEWGLGLSEPILYWRPIPEFPEE